MTARDGLSRNGLRAARLPAVAGPNRAATEQAPAHVRRPLAQLPARRLRTWRRRSPGYRCVANLRLHTWHDKICTGLV